MSRVTLPEYIEENLTNFIDNDSSELDDNFFQQLLNYFNDKNTTSEADKINALKAINNALIMQEQLHYEILSKNSFDVTEENSDISENVKAASLRAIDLHNEKIRRGNKKRALFIDTIFNSPENSLCLAECLVQVSSKKFAKDELKGFVSLRERSQPISSLNNSSSKVRTFNLALAATVAAKSLIENEPLSLTIKNSVAATVVGTHVVSRIFTFFSTDTVNRLESAKRFFPKKGDEETMASKIFAELEALLAVDSKFMKDQSKVAKNKQRVLTQLKEIFTPESSNEDKRSAFIAWKKENDVENVLKKHRLGFLGRPHTRKLVEEVEIALSSSKGMPRSQ